MQQLFNEACNIWHGQSEAKRALTKPDFMQRINLLKDSHIAYLWNHTLTYKIYRCWALCISTTLPADLIHLKEHEPWGYNQHLLCGCSHATWVLMPMSHDWICAGYNSFDVLFFSLFQENTRYKKPPVCCKHLEISICENLPLTSLNINR